METKIQQQGIVGGVLIIVLLFTVLLYTPGLSGSFIFDDPVNLSRLSEINSDRFIETSLRYITEGFSGGLGRPVSLATFAAQYYSWENNPADFKYVNVMLHVLIGVLIFWLFWRLSQLIRLPSYYQLILPLLTATIWLIHPLNVSTVLYVVQRMTQLATLFSVVGLLFYVHGRALLQQHKTLLGYLWTTLGLAVAVGLGTLSKENAVVTLFLIMVLELTLLRQMSKPRYWSMWLGVFVYLPTLLFVGYLVYRFPQFLATYDMRDFTVTERLLTQSRVLLDYIGKIVFPNPNVLGLFHDDFVTSTHLLNPLSTLLSSLFIVISITLALVFRAYIPVFAFGILWFFAAHSVESSFIPLLMYFEHRNYLPSIGFIFAVVYGFLWLVQRMQRVMARRALIGIGVALLGLFAIISWGETRLWGDPLTQRVVWATQHPQSRQALAHAVDIYEHHQQFDKAALYAQRIVQYHPDRTAAYLFWLRLGCRYAEVPMPDPSAIAQRIAHTRYEPVVAQMLDVLVTEYRAGLCRLSGAELNALFDALLHNPHTKDKAHVHHHYAVFLALENRLAAAVIAQRQAIALTKGKQPVVMHLNVINWLLRLGEAEAALDHIAATRQRFNPLTQRLYAESLQQLTAYAQAMRTNSPNAPLPAPSAQ